MNHNAESLVSHEPTASIGALSVEDFRAHFGSTLIEFLLTIERAIQIVTATSLGMPETSEKRRLVDQRADLVGKAMSLRRLLAVAGVIGNQPLQLVVVPDPKNVYSSSEREPAGR